jgi:flagellar biosynthesis component FlhA
VASYSPALVQSVTPRVFSLAQRAEILRRLLDENVSIAGLERVLEQLASCEPNTPLDRGLELARRALREELSERCLHDGVLYVHELDPIIEDALRDATQTIARDRVVALAPELAHDVVQAVRRARALHAVAPVVLTQSDVRRSLRDVVAHELPEVHVLAYTELPPSLPIERREPITIATAPA